MDHANIEVPGSPLLRLGDLAPFFERVSRSRDRALLLDYDGTIAPFAAYRSLAEPYAGMRSALRALALAPKATRVSIVSGRSLEDLRRLTALDGVVDLWGSHGMEHRTREGQRFAEPTPREIADFLSEVRAFLETGGLASVVERKPYGIAIHRRGADPALFEAARSEMLGRWVEPAERVGLQPLAFDGGLELRPAGFDKGIAVRRAFEELGPEAAVAYLGDDATDEDAFRALEGRGMPVLVGEAPRATRARAWIRPGELFRFLESWNAACSGRDP